MGLAHSMQYTKYATLQLINALYAYSNLMFQVYFIRKIYKKIHDFVSAMKIKN